MTLAELAVELLFPGDDVSGGRLRARGRREAPVGVPGIGGDPAVFAGGEGAGGPDPTEPEGPRR